MGLVPASTTGWWQVGWARVPVCPGLGFPRTRDFQPQAHWGDRAPRRREREGWATAWRSGPGKAFLFPVSVEFPSLPHERVWFSFKVQSPIGSWWRPREEKCGAASPRVTAPNETAIARKEAEMLDEHKGYGDFPSLLKKTHTHTQKRPSGKKSDEL